MTEDRSPVSQDTSPVIPAVDEFESAIGRGGDVIFTPGKGNPAGDFIFKLADGSESMRICADGRFFVNTYQTKESHEVIREIEVYYAFKAWLRGAIKTANGVD